MRLLLIVAAMAPFLLAACAGEPGCGRAPILGGATVVAATDPCAGQTQDDILTWYTRGAVKYPLRCGKVNPSGYGYLHILKDDGGHGDPVNNAAFSDQIALTVNNGVEGFAGGGNYRLTLRYDADGRACHGNAWGFRVVLAKSPLRADGYSAGIITAFFLAAQPELFP